MDCGNFASAGGAASTLSHKHSPIHRVLLTLCATARANIKKIRFFYFIFSGIEFKN
jgi:hypothetical protein